MFNHCLHALVCISFLCMESSHQSTVLSLMYCTVLSIKLFSNGECKWCFGFKSLHACGCQVPPSVETGCLPHLFFRDAINRSTTSIALSNYTPIRRISLPLGSIATQSQRYREPTSIWVSPTAYPAIFFLLVDLLFGLCFWIHFQIDTWLLSTNRSNAFAVLL